MGRTTSFVARWRATILGLTLAVALSGVLVGSARADGLELAPGACQLDQGEPIRVAASATSRAKSTAGKYPRPTLP